MPRRPRRRGKGWGRGSPPLTKPGDLKGLKDLKDIPPLGAIADNDLWIEGPFLHATERGRAILRANMWSRPEKGFADPDVGGCCEFEKIT